MICNITMVTKLYVYTYQLLYTGNHGNYYIG